MCLGNICRSPLAEGAVRRSIVQSALAEEIELDSAGTGDWHAGQAPDPRAIECAQRHGVDISDLRARQLQARDFADFDWLLCADASNVRDVLRLAPAQARDKVVLLLDWAGLEQGGSIPDPYTGDAKHFEQVWGMVDEAAHAIVARLQRDRDSGIIRRQ